MATSPQLSIVVPTYKERGNVAELVRRLDLALAGLHWEAIFVDDNSPDRTWQTVKEIAAADQRVRCLRRVGRRGLAGACIEGMASSSAPYVAVMDADLQHDEKVLPQMLARLTGEGADLVAGTRYIQGGSAQTFSQGRGAISRLATWLTRRLTGTGLSDPMSGFFMMRRDRFEEIAPSLSPVGFKILLDIAMTAGERLRVAEQPYSFGMRFEGQSKFNAQIGIEFLGLLLAKMTGDLFDSRFLFFAIVGTIGLAVHLGVLALSLAFLQGIANPFRLAQIIATLVAMISNFVLNNELTYRDRRLKGLPLMRGFVLFCLIASVGVLANVDLASWLYVERPVWWVAGAIGFLMSALWNYAMSTLFVWRAR
ncbi:MAG TPA: glycosyltransferase family 2 protein [Rhizomicrobium sp.]|jgi:dolichol-phosphate mannosyltransferase|nr:glycosyltransferase family 2 protein [Rhizomicrobium sp.]